MIETIEPARGEDDPFKLTVCPGCDYSLENLPTEGTCPECGRTYDQTHIVIVGHGRGKFDTTWRQYLKFGIAAAMMAAMVRLSWGFRPSLMVMANLGFFAFYLVALLFVRLFSARERRAQLWVSEKGIVQVESNPEVRTVMRFVGRAFVPFICIVMVVSMFTNTSRPETWMVTAVVIMVVALNVRAHRGARQKTGFVIPESEVPLLNPWATIEKIEIDECLSGRHRLIVEMPVRSFGSSVRTRVVDFELPFDESRTKLLRDLIAGWTNGRLWCSINDRPN